ncbi:MAG: hypothetical protein HRK26_04640 [Rickettsiaceae bacterium H1]|nr:hypothetical protein [Rickettsiaceae bacterium H1]
MTKDLKVLQIKQDFTITEKNGCSHQINENDIIIISKNTDNYIHFGNTIQIPKQINIYIIKDNKILEIFLSKTLFLNSNDIKGCNKFDNLIKDKKEPSEAAKIIQDNRLKAFKITDKLTINQNLTINIGNIVICDIFKLSKKDNKNINIKDRFILLNNKGATQYLLEGDDTLVLKKNSYTEHNLKQHEHNAIKTLLQINTHKQVEQTSKITEKPLKISNQVSTSAKKQQDKEQSNDNLARTGSTKSLKGSNHSFQTTPENTNFPRNTNRTTSLGSIFKKQGNPFGKKSKNTFENPRYIKDESTNKNTDQIHPQQERVINWETNGSTQKIPVSQRANTRKNTEKEAPITDTGQIDFSQKERAIDCPKNGSTQKAPVPQRATTRKSTENEAPTIAQSYSISRSIFDTAQNTNSEKTSTTQANTSIGNSFFNQAQTSLDEQNTEKKPLKKTKEHNHNQGNNRLDPTINKPESSVKETFALNKKSQLEINTSTSNKNTNQKADAKTEKDQINLNSSISEKKNNPIKTQSQGLNQSHSTPKTKTSAINNQNQAENNLSKNRDNQTSESKIMPKKKSNLQTSKQQDLKQQKEKTNLTNTRQANNQSSLNNPKENVGKKTQAASRKSHSVSIDNTKQNSNQTMENNNNSTTKIDRDTYDIATIKTKTPDADLNTNNSAEDSAQKTDKKPSASNQLAIQERIKQAQKSSFIDSNNQTKYETAKTYEKPSSYSNSSNQNTPSASPINIGVSQDNLNAGDADASSQSDEKYHVKLDYIEKDLSPSIEIQDQAPTQSKNNVQDKSSEQQEEKNELFDSQESDEEFFDAQEDHEESVVSAVTNASSQPSKTNKIEKIPGEEKEKRNIMPVDTKIKQGIDETNNPEAKIMIFQTVNDSNLKINEKAEKDNIIICKASDYLKKDEKISIKENSKTEAKVMDKATKQEESKNNENPDNQTKSDYDESKNPFFSQENNNTSHEPMSKNEVPYKLREKNLSVSNNINSTNPFEEFHNPTIFPNDSNTTLKNQHSKIIEPKKSQPAYDESKNPFSPQNNKQFNPAKSLLLGSLYCSGIGIVTHGALKSNKITLITGFTIFALATLTLIIVCFTNYKPKHNLSNVNETTPIRSQTNFR